MTVSFTPFCQGKITKLHTECFPMKIFFPRFILLRDMVKDATHHPDYKEYCHEATVEVK